MITVTISNDGQFADEIQFDDANVVAYEGTVTVIHRSVMQESDGGGLWQRVAHAAGIVAERGNLPDALEAEQPRQADIIDTALPIVDKAPHVPSELSVCPAPCTLCGGVLEDESGGNNQPVLGLALECRGHWPSTIFDAEPGWLEINICEPCLRTATERKRVLHGDRPSRRARTTYRLWQWPRRHQLDRPRSASGP